MWKMMGERRGFAVNKSVEFHELFTFHQPLFTACEQRCFCSHFFKFFARSISPVLFSVLLAVAAFFAVFHNFTAPTMDDYKEGCFLSNKQRWECAL